MSILYVGNKYRITVSFTTWDESTRTSSVKVPDTIIYTEYTDSIDVANQASTGTPTTVVAGSYYYDYTPTSTGNFFIVFDATFTGSDDEQVIHEFEVVSDGSSASVSTVFQTLVEDQILEFSSGMTPLYLNPEEMIPIFPDSNELEIAEFIHFASLEVLEILCISADEVDFDDLPYIAIEYIKASVGCNLSRIYEDGVGIESSIKLGDMSVTNPTAGGTSRYINRANASTWCQLASALRNELLSESTKFGSKRGVRAFVKGSSYPNPMPDRTIRHTGERRVGRNELRHNRTLKSLED